MSGGQQYFPDINPTGRSGARPSSTQSSSLAGAMGDASSASSTRSHPHRIQPQPYPFIPDWSHSPSLHQPHLSPHHIPFSDPVGNVGFPGSPAMSSDLTGYHYSLSEQRPTSSSSTFGEPQYNLSPQMMGTIPTLARPRSMSNITEEQLQIEVDKLRRKVRALEAEVFQARAMISANPRVSGAPGGSSKPQDPAFRTAWKARTEARKRVFCSFNRAGNALCAWHDSRRERRAYPPRNAPPGVLNCGCTHEEALFEESLARHGVGSYHPGESVRMDPALRNPLLKLLTQRYGYQDGDFERDPSTGEWVEGEGPGYWEHQANSGSSGRKLRTEN